MMLVSKGCMLHDSSCMTFRKRQNYRDGRRNSDCQRLSRSKKELICEMGDSLFFLGGGVLKIFCKILQQYLAFFKYIEFIAYTVNPDVCRFENHSMHSEIQGKNADFDKRI